VRAPSVVPRRDAEGGARGLQEREGVRALSAAAEFTVDRARFDSRETGKVERIARVATTTSARSVVREHSAPVVAFRALPKG